MVKNKNQIIMGKCVKYLVIICASIMSFACTNLDDDLSVVTPKGAEITITASREGFEPNTRTIRESDGSVEWCPLDEISVFYSNGASGGSKFTSQNTEQAAIAEFRGRLEGISAGGENFTNGKYLYGVYPYSLDTKFNNGIITISLPSHQTAADGTFANGLFPTIARAQGVNLAFYNICGGIKFTVSRNDITSVSFKGNNGERIAGTANVTFNSSEIPTVLEEELESKNEIIVYAPREGTFEAGKEYFIVTYPINLSSGFTMTFRTSDMKEGVYVHNNAVEIERSIFGVLNQKDKDITSWTDITTNGGGNNSGIYLGIMGFNQQLYTYPINLLNAGTKCQFDGFVDNLHTDNGTLLYYSIDQAISSLKNGTYPSNLFNTALVTFTDGLDQGSFMMGTSYSTDEEYLNAINNRLINDKVAGLPINAYSIGLRGNDVVDVDKFRLNLQKLASSEDNAVELTDISEVSEKFKNIAENIIENSSVHTVILNMPGLANGTRVRFTFDNVSNADNSNLYIEGTFDLSSKSLTNVKYYGMTSSSGNTIQGSTNGIFVRFVFDEVRTDTKKPLPCEYISEYTYINSTSSWQINSEFEKDEGSSIETEYRSAAIMLVIDCSSSLGSEFSQIQYNVKSFISTLIQAKNEDVENNDDFYKHESVDLGLSSGLKWATYNIGANSAEEYGNYYAWGETETKDVYSTNTSMWDGLNYASLLNQGIINSNGILINSYDAATVNWGDGWRIPTSEEWRELEDECNWDMHRMNGVFGMKITGPNGNSIFRPASGYRQNSSLYHKETTAGYWSSVFENTNNANFYNFHKSSGWARGWNGQIIFSNHYVYGFSATYTGGTYHYDDVNLSIGLTIRPVTEI